MSWLVKRKHYGGGESVVGHEDFKSAAQNIAANLNHDYQSDAYCVEEFDRAKIDWPDINDPKFADLLDGLRSASD